VTAVLELRNKLAGAERNLIDASFLTDVVRQQALEAAPSIKLMTRENVLTLLEASGKKLEDCEGECEVETGRRLGADLVVTGELLRFGQGFRVNLRLHDTRTAQLLAAAVASGESAEALEKDLFGFYLAGGIGSMSGENDTPVTLPPAANSLTLSNLGTNAAGFGIGVRYYPSPWLMLDACYQFVDDSAKVDSRAGDGTTNGGPVLSSHSVSLGANAVFR
jgi:hypothetical protein